MASALANSKETRNNSRGWKKIWYLKNNY
jgi:hypothetical protein